MPYAECKVYSDGSHYIAIPYEPNPRRRRRKPPEEVITVTEEQVEKPSVEANSPPTMPEATQIEGEVAGDQKSADKPVNAVKIERQMTKKELFEELYEQTKNLNRSERKRVITDKMEKYFRDREEAALYVNAQFERKLRNLICRRVRLTRKINLAEFNYFVTFTYDDKKQTEESFKKKLKTCLRHMTERKGWKCAGVWERSPEKQRLHYHGLFYIPEGTLPGEFMEVTDYNTTKHKRQTTKQNSYFLERFGRNDFKPIDTKADLGEAIAYLTKYMEKTGEKIMYSKNMPQFFISDIMDEDVVCPTGQEGKKLVLFDDFGCWDEGTYMGKVSPEVIDQMRKVN